MSILNPYIYKTPRIIDRIQHVIENHCESDLIMQGDNVKSVRLVHKTWGGFKALALLETNTLNVRFFEEGSRWGTLCQIDLQIASTHLDMLNYYTIEAGAFKFELFAGNGALDDDIVLSHVYTADLSLLADTLNNIRTLVKG